MIVQPKTQKDSNYFNFTLLLDDFLVSQPERASPVRKEFHSKATASSDISTDLGSDGSHRGSLLSSPEKTDRAFQMETLFGREKLIQEFTCEPEETRESRFSLSECFKHSSNHPEAKSRVSEGGRLASRLSVVGKLDLKISLKNRHFERLSRKLKRVFENGRRLSS